MPQITDKQKLKKLGEIERKYSWDEIVVAGNKAYNECEGEPSNFYNRFLCNLKGEENVETPIEKVERLHKGILNAEKRSEEYCEALTKRVNEGLSEPVVGSVYTNGSALYVVFKWEYSGSVNMEVVRKIGNIVKGEAIWVSVSDKRVATWIYKKILPEETVKKIAINSDYISIRQNVMNDWFEITDTERKEWNEKAQGTGKSGFELYVEVTMQTKLAEKTKKEMKERMNNYYKEGE